MPYVAVRYRRDPRNRLRNLGDAALELAEGVTDHERAYIEAMSLRYEEDPISGRARQDTAYARAMRSVADAYPEDPDAQVLAARALGDIGLPECVKLLSPAVKAEDYRIVDAAAEAWTSTPGDGAGPGLVGTTSRSP